MDINFPSSIETLPPESGRTYLSNLDSLLQKSQQGQYDRTRTDLSNAGLLNSGDQFTPAASQVLPSKEQQRNSFELPEVQRAYGMGRNERLASIAFQHQREFADSEFQRRLQELQAEADARKSLIDYKRSLQGGFDIGGALGSAAGTAAGAYFGGPVGAAAGGKIGGSVFSQKSGLY